MRAAHLTLPGARGGLYTKVVFRLLILAVVLWGCALGGAFAQDATNASPDLVVSNPPPPIASATGTPERVSISPAPSLPKRDLRDYYLLNQSARMGAPSGARELKPTELPRPERAWMGEVETGATVNRGNTDSDLLLLKLKATREREDDEFTLGAQGFLGHNDGERNQENASAHTAYRHTLRDRFFYAAEARYYFDALAELDYQVMALLSLGYDVLREKDLRLSLEAGPAYIVERKGGDENNFWAARLAISAELLIEQRALIWERAEYMPSLEDAAVYLALGEVGVDTILSSWLRFRTSMQIRYDSQPAEDKDNTDLFMAVSLVLVY